ncbi:MAG: Ig-like domain repeat protein [Chloroflexota bacterium]|jgi:hypothetical protein
MSKRIWILIASFIPALALTIALLQIMSPKSEAAPISAISIASDIAAVNQSCGYETNVLADNPVTYWRLDDVTGTMAVNLGSIGSAVDGTYSNGVITGVTGLVTGDPDFAAQFDGNNDYVGIPGNNAINGNAHPQRTIELWFRADTLSGKQVLYEEGDTADGFNVFLDDDELNFGVWATNIGTWVTQSVETDSIYHVALVFEGSVGNGTISGYLNGTSFVSDTTSFDTVPAHSGDNIAIGAIRDDSRYPNPSGPVIAALDDFFDGVIDDVVIYNDVLSAETIQLHAAGCAIPSETTIDEITPTLSVVGQPVTVTFSVTTSLPSTVTPTGSVTVTISSGSEFCGDTLTNGTGQCLITPTITGTHTLTATYGGNASFIGSSITETHTVTKANTTTTMDDEPESSVVGEPVTVSFTVTVDSPGSGTPTGNVTVTTSSGSDSCLDNLSAGAGQCQIIPTLVGTHTITATYEGDTKYNGSVVTETHTVNQAATTTTITDDTPDPSALNEPLTVTFSVTVDSPGSGIPTGMVTVTISSEPESCMSVLSDGEGQCQITPTITGTHTLTATYSGDVNFADSFDTESHRVNEASSTTAITDHTPDPSVVGQPVTVEFVVTSTLPDTMTPTGSVTVTISGGPEICVDTTLTNGAGQCQITPTIAGNRTLIATYSGDTYFASSSDTAPHTVNKAGTTTTIIDDSPDPSFAEQPFTVEFSVEAISPGSGTPTGNVTVTISGGSESCVGTLSAGIGQCQITPTSAGNRTLTATYGGDANYNGSNGKELHRVNEAKLLIYMPIIFKS